MPTRADDDDSKCPAEYVRWMVATNIDRDWLFIPVRALVRGLVPQQLYSAGYRFGFEIVDTGESIVTSAVRVGTWMTAAHLKLVCNYLGVEPPKSKQGSGPNGEIRKVDWAKNLVEFLFPDTDGEEKQRMIAAITWKGSITKLGDKEKEILEWVSQLDEENREAPEFKRIVKLAKNQIKEQETSNVIEETRKLLEKEYKRSALEEAERTQQERLAAEKAALEEKPADPVESKEPDARAAEASSSTRKPSSTPPSLKDFLTSEMVSAKISLNRDASGYGYRAFYPSVLL